jgi:hypothetical protein
MTHRSRKSIESSCFEVLYVLFRGLKASSVAWEFLISAVNFFPIFGHQNPKSGTGSAIRKMLDPYPH